MGGLLLLFIAVIWFIFAVWLNVRLTGDMEPGPKTTVIQLGLFALIFTSPLADEIVGGRQFARLCAKNSSIQVDREKAASRTVYLDFVQRKEVDGTWVPVSLEHWQYVDATTRELVVSYNILRAKGGWLIRSLSLFEGDVPLTFESSCAPENRPASPQGFEKFGLKHIQPPTDD